MLHFSLWELKGVILRLVVVVEVMESRAEAVVVVVYVNAIDVLEWRTRVASFADPFCTRGVVSPASARRDASAVRSRSGGPVRPLVGSRGWAGAVPSS